jgi:hypothetical protein
MQKKRYDWEFIRYIAETEVLNASEIMNIFAVGRTALYNKIDKDEWRVLISKSSSNQVRSDKVKDIKRRLPKLTVYYNSEFRDGTFNRVDRIEKLDTSDLIEYTKEGLSTLLLHKAIDNLQNPKYAMQTIGTTQANTYLKYVEDETNKEELVELVRDYGDND